MNIPEKLHGMPHTDEFRVIDTIGVPHPYCVGARHVVHAADNFGGILSKEAIRDGERHGISCEVRGCNLSFDEHEEALLVECRVDIEHNEANQEFLRNYLQELIDYGVGNYAGFSFIKEEDVR